MKRALALLWLGAGAGSLLAQGPAVSGRVLDLDSRAPLGQATVSIEGFTLSTNSDNEGRYQLQNVPPGPQVLRVIRIGYAPSRQSVVIPPSGTLVVDLLMTRSALNLPGVTVTADPISRATGELGTASVIDREAIRNQAATSLQGILELLPGVVLQPPGLESVQQFGLRGIPVSPGNATSVGASQPNAGELASFGTQIVLDGVPASNNANLQTLGPRGELAFATSAGGGIDLRRIPASTIERVEVIRGVPSARFGDLSQGAILVETRAGRINPEVQALADPRSIQASLVGGSGFSAKQTGSGSFDVTRTRVAPGRTDDASYRFAAQLAHRYERGRVTLDTRLDGYQLVQDIPEVDQFPGIESHSRDRAIRVSERARFGLGSSSRVEWTGAFELTRQRSMSRNNLLRAAEPFTNRLTEGTQVGKFIGGVYNAQVDVEGDPRFLYHRVELIAQPHRLSRNEIFRAGVELRREWNAGPGLLFDVEFPPQSTFNGVNGYDRPRRFDSLPPLVTTGLYLDDRETWSLGSEGTISIQGGVRMDLLHEGSTWLSGVRSSALQPRLNIEIAPRRWLRLRAGAGRLAKLPSLTQLYPEAQYYDLVNVNYYANDPAERLAVLTTRILDPTNPGLGFSRTTKLEAGFEASLGRAEMAFTAFRDRTSDAVGTISTPSALYRDLFQIVDSTRATGRPPSYEPVPYATDTVPALIDRPSNNLTMQVTGAELTAILPELRGTGTRLAVSGSYLKTRVENTGVEFGSALTFSEFQLTGFIRRTPYWEGTIRTGDRLLLTTRLIHQQAPAGLIITGTIQLTLRETRQDLGSTDSLSFAGYLTRSGELVPVPAEQRSAPEYQDLRIPRGGLLVDPQRGPVDWLFSLQVAKTLPAGGRLSFYAFNAFDRRGNYGGAQTTPRLYPAARFGLEVTMPIAGSR